MEDISAAPRSGKLVAIWSPKEPGILRIAKWGISRAYPKSEPCWITFTGNAISNIPTHFISIDLPPNAALSGPRADDGKSDAGPRSA